ncbi:MAG: SBBP repeat-containing protein [Ferruginibacter sp.]
MKYKFILTAIAIFCAFTHQAQVQQAWVARANGVENKNESARAIAVDAAGFIYVSGARFGTADDNNSGFLTVKYNPVNGHVIWAHINDGNGGGNASPHAMTVDAAGNVYVTGSGGRTTVGQKYFTIKYNTNGDLLWEHDYTNSASGEYGNAIAVDASGNVFVTGFSTSDDDYWSIGTIKYDAAGNRKWVKHYKGDSKTNDQISGKAIAVDASGNIFVAGYKYYEGSNKDLIILKYNTNGDLVSSNRYDGPGNDEPVAMKIDPAGNICITGKSIRNGFYDCITLKYNSNCNIIWENLYDGPSGKGDVPSDIAIDANGNIFITGLTDGGAATKYDMLTVKYSAAGVKLWDKIYNGPQNVKDVANAIAIDPEGNAYITGYSGDIGGYQDNTDYVTIKYNALGVQQWLKSYDSPAGMYDEALGIVIDANGSIYVTGDSYTLTTLLDMGTIKYTQCDIVCPANIAVGNDAGKCDAVVNFNPATYTGDCGNSFTYSHNTGIAFPVGITTVTATSDQTGASCSFTITVRDNELPVFTFCPASKSVSSSPGLCFATAAAVNAGTATATDNCSLTVSPERSDGLSITDNYPIGVTTITWTAKDASDNVRICTQLITVVDNEFPVISNQTASPIILSNPNHTMRDVYIGYTATDNCGVTTSLTVSSNEPINGVGDGDTDPDWIVLNNHNVQLRAERAANGNGRIYTITIRAVDTYGNVTTKTLEVRVPHDVKSPRSGQPFVINSTVNFSGEFWDKLSNRHTAKWLLDGSPVTNGIVTEPTATQNGKINGSYKFTSAGVYKLQMNVIDQAGVISYANTNGDLDATVVIYDPNGSYTYGGGWYPSVAGALRSDLSASGKASFGFAINYTNAAKPKGETQFEFKVGNFEFNALNFDYLAVNAARAQFRGTGKIVGGQSGIGFIMTVIDGALDGTGLDKIRLKIYNRNTLQVYYDNQYGASDADNPSTTVGANSTIFIQGTHPNNSITKTPGEMIIEKETNPGKLQLTAFPNPASKQFTLLVKTNDAKQNIVMQVADEYGRLLETRNNVKAGAIIQLGRNYQPGIYYIQIMQGKNHEEMKLIKL